MTIGIALMILADCMDTSSGQTQTNQIAQAPALPKRCVITLELRESHVTLDIWQHVEDAANAITMEIPVDREFYDSVKVGDMLKNELKSGSLVLSGTFGSWEVRIKKKEER
jgi:hypothetical protein